MNGIGLMYIEGEVKEGYLTGRTVLVIETDRLLDPSQLNSAADLQRLVSAACLEWEKRFRPADLVRLDYRESDGEAQPCAPAVSVAAVRQRYV